MRANSKLEYTVKECVKKLSDDDIKFFYARLTQRLGGDVAEVLTYIGDCHGELNKILMAAPSCEAIYDVVDMIDDYSQDEFKRRFQQKIV